ncbi:hypothetical protein DdX_04627 [Ditylenchus destructor]|uniref:Uncharacterized protein n=1 Tax=Ditylenchus destructor TaxID=166010 RepID=A0AAD4R4Q0_9BILA|nr:hypothetical protein DdX_04627 [Ditylenchus destructor]
MKVQRKGGKHAPHNIPFKFPQNPVQIDVDLATCLTISLKVMRECSVSDRNYHPNSRETLNSRPSRNWPFGDVYEPEIASISAASLKNNSMRVGIRVLNSTTGKSRSY